MARPPSSTAISSCDCYADVSGSYSSPRLKGQTMELREYWSIIRRRWWLPVAVALVALLASTAVGLRGAAAFKTDMRLAVSTIPVPDPNVERYYDPTYYADPDSECLADDMSEFMTNRAVADEVKRELATSSTPIDVDIDGI